jgi:LPXTG-motif cell wall-anchored protein
MFARYRSKTWSRIFTFSFGIIALCSIFSGAASAQLSQKKTVVTFTVPVEIPDAGAQVLPPGTYVFKLVDSQSDRNIVQILSKDELHVFATILAIPNFRLKATDKTVMTFEERAAGEPQAIRAWFYPGERWGQEFVYPKKKAVELAKATNLPVAYIPDEVAVSIVPTPIKTVSEPVVIVLKEVPVQVFKPTGEVVQVAEVFEAPPLQVVKTASALPKTGSALPLIGLLGFLLISLSFVISRLCAHHFSSR